MSGFQIKFFLREGGVCPFVEWLEGLKDREARARIKVRLDRLERGNLGDAKSVGEGVFEMRMPHGPGYRIYFGREGADRIVVLWGGSKKDQEGDVRKAKSYWQGYKEEKHDAKEDA